MGKGAEGARTALRAVGRALASPPGALLLFALTFATTTLQGAFLAGEDPFLGWSRAAEGLSFSLPLLFILLSHEAGHWVAARRHGLPSTPPLFLPGPFGAGLFSPGTFGAFIRIRSAIPGRDALLDVGASGPFAGFVATVPVLVRGLSLSQVVPVAGPSGFRLGEPLVFKLLSFLVLGPLPEGHDVLLHPVALAGWFGLFVTMLNLLPAGQLDGGHVAYALFGPGWGRVARLVPAAALLLGLLYRGWILFAALLFFLLRTSHPPTGDDGAPLSGWRRAAAWGAVALFVLCFIPMPVEL